MQKERDSHQSPDMPPATDAATPRTDDNALFRALVNAVKDYAIFALDPEGYVTTWNEGAMRLKGYRAEEITGRHFSVFYPAPDRANCKPQTGLVIAREQGRFEEEGLRVRQDGTTFWANVVITPIRAATGQVVGFTKVTRDVSERKRLEQEKEKLLREALDRADRDPLTLLYNHSTFHRLLLAAARDIDRTLPRRRTGFGRFTTGPSLATGGGAEPQDRHSDILLVAAIDIDNFKFFNDTYGHQAGDEVLGSVASILRGCCEAADVVARIGGDEFGIVLRRSNRSAAETWAEHLRHTVSQLNFSPPGEASPTPIRLSVGVAFYPEEAASPHDALYLADKRAMRAKYAGDDVLSRETERLRTALYDEIDGYSMLDALVSAVDNKDRYTRRHSDDVMVYVSRITEVLNLPVAERQSLQVAALVHDVGKIGVPNQILRKPGALTPDEMSIMRRHPELGGLLVAAVPELAHTLDAVRYHHERWDGLGYPEGMRGDAIPQAARILAVADAYSAMTSDRPYRRGLPSDEAVARLRAGAGQFWDQTCVEALCQALHAERS